MRTNNSLGGVTLESLEQRKLMTAAATITLPSISVLFREPTAKLRDGILYVKGSQDSDNIIADIIPKTATSPALLNLGGADVLPSTVLYVSGNSVTGTPLPAGPTFVLGDVKKIIVDAGSGDDKVDLSALDIPSEIYGGAGNDTLLGTAANDTIYGGNGNDAITDGAGNDLLVGGNGNDTLSAHAGIDILLGQGGNDSLASLTSTGDVLNGGAGDDSSFAGNVPASLGNVEHQTGYAFLTSTSTYATLTLRAEGNHLFVDADLNLLSSGIAVSWQILQDSANGVLINANLFSDTDSTFAQHQASPLTHTFELNQSLRPHPLKISLRQNGQPVLQNKFLVTRSLGQQTAHSPTPADGELLNTILTPFSSGLTQSAQL